MFGWMIVEFFYNLLGHNRNERATRARMEVALNLSLVDQYRAELVKVERRLQKAVDRDDLLSAYDLLAERDSLDRMIAAARIGQADAACELIYAQ